VMTTRIDVEPQRTLREGQRTLGSDLD